MSQAQLPPVKFLAQGPGESGHRNSLKLLRQDVFQSASFQCYVSDSGLGAIILTDRIKALDGLRGLAAFTVLLFHAKVPSVLGGFLAVDVFFVLSGFVITRLLLGEVAETGRINLLSFYIRRIARLVPAYALFLCVYLIVAPMLWPGQNHVWYTIISAAYLSDYAFASGSGLGGLGHTWSLSIEEHFYLLWPLALPLAVRRPWILITFYIAVTAWRWGLPVKQAYYRFDAHCTGLIIGALVAICQAKVRESFGFGAMLLLAYLMFIGRIWSPISTTWVTTLTEMATAILIMSLQNEGQMARAISIRPLLWLGSMSYSLYLWHVPIAVMIRPHSHWLVTVTATTAASLLLAYLSGRYVETPARRWGARVAQRVRSEHQRRNAQAIEQVS